MVSIKLGDRGKMRSYLEEVFFAIDNRDYLNARRALDKFRYFFKMYHVTRGFSVSQFDDIFDEIYYTLAKVPNNQYKKSILEDLMEQLSKTLNGYSISSSPLEKLRDLYSEIRYNYGIITKENTSAAILDAFDEVRLMKPDFEELGEPTINFFPAMVASFSDAEPILMQIAGLERPPATLLSKLADKFSAVFMSMQKVLAPPIRIPITREEILMNLKNGASLSDIADGTANSEAELRAILQGDSESVGGGQVP